MLIMNQQQFYQASPPQNPLIITTWTIAYLLASYVTNIHLQVKIYNLIPRCTSDDLQNSVTNKTVNCTVAGRLVVVRSCQTSLFACWKRGGIG